MVVSFEVVAAVLVAVLLVFTAYALTAGILGGVFGERFARCPRCGRFGLTVGGRRHRGGCPPSPHDFATQLVHNMQEIFHAVHLRH